MISLCVSGLSNVTVKAYLFLGHFCEKQELEIDKPFGFMTEWLQKLKSCHNISNLKTSGEDLPALQ